MLMPFRLQQSKLSPSMEDKVLFRLSRFRFPGLSPTPAKSQPKVSRPQTPKVSTWSYGMKSWCVRPSRADTSQIHLKWSSRHFGGLRPCCRQCQSSRIALIQSTVWCEISPKLEPMLKKSRLFYGDSWQILLDTEGGSPAHFVHACFKTSPLYRQSRALRLVMIQTQTQMHFNFPACFEGVGKAVSRVKKKRVSSSLQEI